MANNGWASDYLRQLNTQGPGNPGNVVSSKVQYVSPVVQTEAETNDTPLYDNDGGFNPGPQRLVSAPARPFRGNATAAQRAARPKRTQSRSRGSAPANGVKTRSAPLSGTDVTAAVMKAVKADGNTSFANWRQSLVNQGWDGDPAKIKYDPTTGKFIDTTGGSMPSASTGTYKDASDPMSQRILANGSPEPKPPVESAVSGAQDITDQSDTYRAIAGLSSPPSANDSEQSAPESSSIADQFKNMPWYKDAKAHHEAVKKNMDDYGYALGTLKSTWDDIPWWTKLVMLPPVFKAGSPAVGASTTGNVWAEGGLAAAGDATAGAKAFEETLSRMNGGAVRGAPVEGTARRSFSSAAEGRESAAGAVGSKAGESATGAGSKSSFGFDLSAEDVAAANAANAAARQQAGNLSEMRTALIRDGMPDREIEAYMQRAGFYNNPEALRQAIDVVRKYGTARLFEHSAARAAAARAGSAAGTGAGSAAGTGSRGSFGFDLSPEEIASAKASHDAYVRGTAGAADGGVSELANAGNAGRSSADEAMEVAARLDELVRSIESGTVDEMGKAWIEALANQKAAGFESETINYILDAARAAGVIK